MKLELKHLAPYLPYGLEMYYETILGDVRVWTLRDGTINEVLSNQNKPILRPLSDLNNEINISGYGKIIPIDYFENDCEDDFFADTDFKEYIDMWILTPTIEFGKLKYLPNGIVSQLLEWHFDVFGLIEKGLAIDANTL